MFEVILYQPEIPGNTGNIIRLCANSGARLHLIEPLGFDIDAKALRRAGLDYREGMVLNTHADLPACLDHLAIPDARRLFVCTTRGNCRYSDVDYRRGDAFLFGSESSGLPDSLREDSRWQARVRLPMMPGSRSLNLSNTVAAVIYEAWRQQGFEGAADGRD